jgi:hypothetical protein
MSFGMYEAVAHRLTLLARINSSSLKKEAIDSSETSVLTRPTRRHVPEDYILHSHIREDIILHND